MGRSAIEATGLSSTFTAPRRPQYELTLFTLKGRGIGAKIKSSNNQAIADGVTKIELDNFYLVSLGFFSVSVHGLRRAVNCQVHVCFAGSSRKMLVDRGNIAMALLYRARGLSCGGRIHSADEETLMCWVHVN